MSISHLPFTKSFQNQRDLDKNRICSHLHYISIISNNIGAIGTGVAVAATAMDHNQNDHHHQYKKNQKEVIRMLILDSLPPMLKDRDKTGSWNSVELWLKRLALDRPLPNLGTILGSHQTAE
jgi:hypothetical protein